MMIEYPNLAGEIAKRGVKKRAIASTLGISEKSLFNKMSGSVEFTWKEVCKIQDCFFPDREKDELFRRAERDELFAEKEERA